MNTKQPAVVSDDSDGQSCLQRLGGPAQLAAVVGAFYFNVLNDERVAHFFAAADVNAVRNHQRMFLTMALGGENHYRGRSLGEAHRELVTEQGLALHHVDAVLEILGRTLRNFGYADELVAEVNNAVAALAGDVLEGS